MEIRWMEIALCDIFFTWVSILRSRTLYATEKDLKDVMRAQLEPFVFDILKTKYGQTFQTFWNQTTLPKTSDKAVVFVERRSHPNLKFCLQNAAYFARGYTIHIVCSKANLEFVQHICGKQLANIHIYVQDNWTTIGTPEEGKRDYNALLKQTQFWEQFQEEHLILMETDSYLRRPIPDSIYAYDYVAARWPWKSMEPGGGGLTYRKKSMMLHLCSVSNIKDNTDMQDIFVSNGVEKHHYTTPSLEDSAMYFGECLVDDKNIGTHQWWTFIVQQVDEIIRIITEMTRLYI